MLKKVSATIAVFCTLIASRATSAAAAGGHPQTIHLSGMVRDNLQLAFGSPNGQTYQITAFQYGTDHQWHPCSSCITLSVVNGRLLPPSTSPGIYRWGNFSYWGPGQAMINKRWTQNRTLPLNFQQSFPDGTTVNLYLAGASLFYYVPNQPYTFICPGSNCRPETAK